MVSEFGAVVHEQELIPVQRMTLMLMVFVPSCSLPARVRSRDRPLCGRKRSLSVSVPMDEMSEVEDGTEEASGFGGCGCP